MCPENTATGAEVDGRAILRSECDDTPSNVDFYADVGKELFDKHCETILAALESRCRDVPGFSGAKMNFKWRTTL